MVTNRPTCQKIELVLMGKLVHDSVKEFLRPLKYTILTNRDGTQIQNFQNWAF